MAILEWNDELSVGHDMIDKQHLILVRLINLLSVAIEREGSDELLGAVIETLADFAHTHFAYEEELFEAAGYPHTAAHKAKRAAELDQVTDLKATWEDGDTEMGEEEMTFFIEWVRAHILKSDREHMPFANATTDMRTAS